MNEKLDKQLVAAFPTLYQNRNKRYGATPCAMFGFECSDGWGPLLYEVSRGLEWLNGLGKGTVIAAQVKEKFGTLRFYVDIDTEDSVFREVSYALIDKAERKSSYTCEVCGKDGALRSGGWVRTLCNECEESRRKV